METSFDGNFEKGVINNMEKRLKELYKEINVLLNNAPTIDDCTDAENEVYSDMANLKNSMENAGYAD